MMREENKRSLEYWEQIFAEHREQKIQTDDLGCHISELFIHLSL